MHSYFCFASHWLQRPTAATSEMTASFTCSVVSLLCRYHISRIVRGQRKKLSKCIMPRHLANKSSVVLCNDRVPLIWCHVTKHNDSFFDHSTYARAYQLAQCLNPKWLIKHLRVRFVFFFHFCCHERHLDACASTSTTSVFEIIKLLKRFLILSLGIIRYIRVRCPCVFDRRMPTYLFIHRVI